MLVLHKLRQYTANIKNNVVVDCMLIPTNPRCTIIRTNNIKYLYTNYINGAGNTYVYQKIGKHFVQISIYHNPKQWCCVLEVDGYTMEFYIGINSAFQPLITITHYGTTYCYKEHYLVFHNMHPKRDSYTKIQYIVKHIRYHLSTFKM